MKHLASHIRKGLATPGVEEVKGIWCYEIAKKNVILANVIGLALIGLLGVKQAAEEVAETLDMIGDDAEGWEKSYQDLLDKLGTTKKEVEKLEALHKQYSANQIALQLESGAIG